MPLKRGVAIQENNTTMKIIKTLFNLIILSTISISLQAQDTLKYDAGNYSLHAGTVTELTLIYIGADTCSPCHAPSLKQALENVKVKLLKFAESNDLQFSVIGIANDISIDRGLDFLKNSGYFDEIIVGKNFLNTGTVDYIWNNDQTDYEIPQVIVFEREITIGDNISVGPKNYVAKYSGKDEIEEWVKNGAVLNQ